LTPANASAAAPKMPIPQGHACEDEDLVVQQAVQRGQVFDRLLAVRRMHRGGHRWSHA
jgi:hypothetical protein